MKRKALALLLAALCLLAPLSSLAVYKDSEAYNVAKRVIRDTLEKEGCDSFTFVYFDYNVHRGEDLYAVYSDVKYVDAKGKNQRDYYVFMFRETKEGYEPTLLILGTRFVIMEEGQGV